MKDRLKSALFQSAVALVVIAASVLDLLVRKETHD